MAVLVHPQSELIREPQLLVPGMRPIGNVRVNDGHWSCNGEQYSLFPHLNSVIQGSGAIAPIIGTTAISWAQGMLTHSGAANVSALTVINPPWQGWTKGSVLMGIKLDAAFSSSGFGVAWSLQDDNESVVINSTAIYLGPGTSGTYTDELAVFSTYNTDALNLAFAITSPTYTKLNDLQPHYVLFCIGDGNNRAYVDGVKATVAFGVGNAGTTGYFTNHADAPDRSWLGVRYVAALNGSIAQKFPLWRIWKDTTFNDAQGCDLTRDPYQFLIPA